MQTLPMPPALPRWKAPLAGALAGACLVLAVMLVVSVLFYLGALFQYTFNSQIPGMQDTAWSAVLQDVGRLPAFLWGWRGILGGVMLSGTLLGLLDHALQRYPVAWRGRVAVTIVVVVVTSIVLANVLMSEEQSLLTQDNPETNLLALAQNRTSIWQQVIVGLAPAAAAAGALWMGWSWWFRHWQRWLAAQLPRNLQEAPERSADDWFQKRQAEARVNRALFAALIGAALVLAVAITGYEQFRVSIASGTLWLEPSAATTTARLVVNRPVQRVLVENTFGEGVVVAELRSVAASTAVFEQASLTLHGIPREYTHAQVGPNTLAPGAYILTMRLQSGTGGRVSYALVQSNGFASQVVAVLVSLFGGIVLALVVLLLSVRFTGAE